MQTGKKKSSNYRKIANYKKMTKEVKTDKDAYTHAKNLMYMLKRMKTIKRACPRSYVYLIPCKTEEMHVCSMILFHSRTPRINFVHCRFSPN